MKQLLSVFVLLAVGALTLQAQVNRDLGSFDEVVVSGGIELELVKGEEGKAEIDLMGVDESDLNIKIQGSTIKFSLLKSLWGGESYVRIKLQYEDLYAVKAAAGAELNAMETIEATDLNIKVQSGANADLKVSADYLDITVSEGATLMIEGTTKREDVNVHTGAKLAAQFLEAERSVVRAHTGGEAVVHASKFFDGYATTGGQIIYGGDPEEVRVKTNLAGEIDSK